MDDIILDGFFNCLQCSLRYLLDNTDKERSELLPLMEVKLELQVRRIVGAAYVHCAIRSDMRASNQHSTRDGSCCTCSLAAPAFFTEELYTYTVRAIRSHMHASNTHDGS